MLVLSRKPGEKVLIGGHIIFTVLEVRGNKVRIGVDAPFEVPIVRGEIRQRTVGAREGRSREPYHAVGSP